MIAANKLKAKAAGAKVIYGYLDTGDSAGTGWTIWDDYYEAVGFDFDSTFNEWKKYSTLWSSLRKKMERVEG